MSEYQEPRIRMRQRWDEHRDAMPYLYVNGRAYVLPSYYEHADFKRFYPEAWEQLMDTLGGWRGDTSKGVYFGRVFSDGEIVDWSDESIPPEVHQAIEEAAKQVIQSTSAIKLADDGDGDADDVAGATPDIDIDTVTPGWGGLRYDPKHRVIKHFEIGYPWIKEHKLRKGLMGHHASGGREWTRPTDKANKGDWLPNEGTEQGMAYALIGNQLYIAPNGYHADIIDYLYLRSPDLMSEDKMAEGLWGYYNPEKGTFEHSDNFRNNNWHQIDITKYLPSAINVFASINKTANRFIKMVDFTPTGFGGEGGGGRRPGLYDPRTGILYIGPYNASHAELITHIPELEPHMTDTGWDYMSYPNPLSECDYLAFFPEHDTWDDYSEDSTMPEDLAEQAVQQLHEEHKNARTATTLIPVDNSAYGAEPDMGRPFVYNKNTDKLYIGIDDGFHEDLLNEINRNGGDADYSTCEMGFLSNDGKMTFYFGWTPEEKQQVENLIYNWQTTSKHATMREMERRIEQHFDAVPFIYFRDSGAVYPARPYDTHNTILEAHPEVFGEGDEAIEYVLEQPNIFFGRVFPDGEVIAYDDDQEDKLTPDEKQKIRDECDPWFHRPAQPVESNRMGAFEPERFRCKVAARELSSEEQKALTDDVVGLANYMRVGIEFIPGMDLRLSVMWHTKYSKDESHCFFVQVPEIKTDLDYAVALHELGHTAFRIQYGGDINFNSREEELWAHHWALEYSRIPFDQETMEDIQSLFATYDHIGFVNESADESNNPNWVRNDYSPEQLFNPTEYSYNNRFGPLDPEQAEGWRGYQYNTVRVNAEKRLFPLHDNIGQGVNPAEGWNSNNALNSQSTSGWTRTSMAERSGDPQLDALIEEFMSEQPSDPPSQRLSNVKTATATVMYHPEKKIRWGKIMDDSVQRLRDEYQQSMPERTAGDPGSSTMSSRMSDTTSETPLNRSDTGPDNRSNRPLNTTPFPSTHVPGLYADLPLLRSQAANEYIKRNININNITFKVGSTKPLVNYTNLYYPDKSAKPSQSINGNNKYKQIPFNQANFKPMTFDLDDHYFHLGENRDTIPRLPFNSIGVDPHQGALFRVPPGYKRNHLFATEETLEFEDTSDSYQGWKVSQAVPLTESGDTGPQQWHVVELDGENEYGNSPVGGPRIAWVADRDTHTIYVGHGLYHATIFDQIMGENDLSDAQDLSGYGDPVDPEILDRYFAGIFNFRGERSVDWTAGANEQEELEVDATLKQWYEKQSKVATVHMGDVYEGDIPEDWQEHGTMFFSWFYFPANKKLYINGGSFHYELVDNDSTLRQRVENAIEGTEPVDYGRVDITRDYSSDDTQRRYWIEIDHASDMISSDPEYNQYNEEDDEWTPHKPAASDDSEQAVVAWLKGQGFEIDDPYAFDKTATEVVNIESVKPEEAYGERTRRIPFVYSPTEDKLFIGPYGAHHVEVIYAAYGLDDTTPEDWSDPEFAKREEIAMDLEDDPGNLGIIVETAKEITYWGEPHDAARIALNRLYPGFVEYIYGWEDDGPLPPLESHKLAFNVVDTTGDELLDNRSVRTRARAVAFASDGQTIYFGTSHPQIIGDLFGEQDWGRPMDMSLLVDNWVFGWADRISPDDPWNVDITSGNYWDINKKNQGYGEKIKRAVQAYLNTGTVESHIKEAADARPKVVDYFNDVEWPDPEDTIWVWDTHSNTVYIAHGDWHHVNLLGQIGVDPDNLDPDRYRCGAISPYGEASEGYRLQDFPPEIQKAVMDRVKQNINKTAITWGQFNNRWDLEADDFPVDYMALIYDGTTDKLYTSKELNCAPYHPVMLAKSPELRQTIEEDPEGLYFGSAVKDDGVWRWRWESVEEEQGDEALEQRANELTIRLLQPPLLKREEDPQMKLFESHIRSSAIIPIETEFYTRGFFFMNQIAFAYLNTGDLYITNGHHPDIVNFIAEDNYEETLYEMYENDEIVFGWMNKDGRISFGSGNYEERSDRSEEQIKEQATQYIREHWGEIWQWADELEANFKISADEEPEEKDWEYVGIFVFYDDGSKEGRLEEAMGYGTHFDLLEESGILSVPDLIDKIFCGWIFYDPKDNQIVATASSVEFGGNIDLYKKAMKALGEAYPGIKLVESQPGMYQWDDDSLPASDWGRVSTALEHVEAVQPKIDSVRQPLLWHRPTDRLYIGEPGSCHPDLFHAAGEDPWHASMIPNAPINPNDWAAGMYIPDDADYYDDDIRGKVTWWPEYGIEPPDDVKQFADQVLTPNR